MKRTPKPPADLSAEAKSLWRRIFQECEMDEAAVVLLDALAQQWDRVKQARALIVAGGLTITEKTAAGCEKRRPHPAVAIERDAAAAMMRAWRLLGFDQQPPGV